MLGFNISFSLLLLSYYCFKTFSTYSSDYYYWKTSIVGLIIFKLQNKYLICAYLSKTDRNEKLHCTRRLARLFRDAGCVGVENWYLRGCFVCESSLKCIGEQLELSIIFFIFYIPVWGRLFRIIGEFSNPNFSHWIMVRIV